MRLCTTVQPAIRNWVISRPISINEGAASIPWYSPACSVSAGSGINTRCHNRHPDGITRLYMWRKQFGCLRAQVISTSSVGNAAHMFLP